MLVEGNRGSLKKNSIQTVLISTRPFRSEELIAVIKEKLGEIKIILTLIMIVFHLSSITCGTIGALYFLLLQRRGDIEFHS
tara:strand:+ start:1266 stop:1508 length:243 start_codon:yes stop_codon:yes gene_type:complete